MVAQASGHSELVTGVIFLPDCKHLVSVSRFFILCSVSHFIFFVSSACDIICIVVQKTGLILMLSHVVSCMS